MAECSKCGEEDLLFTCRYCGKQFCTEHRLPENHECEKLEETVEKEREQSKKWFAQKEPEKEVIKGRKVKNNSTGRDIIRALTNNYTLAIISVTVIAYFLQMMLGASFERLLILEPAFGSLASKPWSLLTVMLLHGSTFHIFANMVTFYFFGSVVEKEIGGQRMLGIYILSGLFASLCFVVFRNILFQLYGPTLNGLPTLGAAVGASGAVVAMFAVVAMLYPKAEVLLYFFIPMKIQTALYAFGGLELFNLTMKAVGVTLPVIGNFASSAHLGGLLIGIYYGRKIRGEKSAKTPVLDLLDI